MSRNEGWSEPCGIPTGPARRSLIQSKKTSAPPGLFYIHGALHLYHEDGEVKKHSWKRQGIRLVELVKEGLNKGQYPLFVAEGKSEKKEEQILNNGYLSYCYGKLRRVQNAIFTVGCSLGDNDWHIYRAIAENLTISQVYVGTFAKPKSPGYRQINKTIALMKDRRNLVNDRYGNRSPLEINLFDSKTAQVWGK